MSAFNGDFDHTKVGKALQEVPIGEMLYGLCYNVAETQQKLDINSIEQLLNLAKQKIDLPNSNGGTTSTSLLTLGFVPSFYHFSEANFHLKVDIKHEMGGEKTFGINVGLNAEYANGRKEKINQYQNKKNVFDNLDKSDNINYSRYQYAEVNGQNRFITKNVNVISNIINSTATKDTHNINDIYLTREQVEKFNYFHQGQLWRPRIIVQNAIGGPVALCMLNLQSNGDLDRSSLSGGSTYQIVSRSNLSDTPQAGWPDISVPVGEPVITYIEDPADATAPIEVKYKVAVMTDTSPADRDDKQWGIVCFTDSSGFDRVGGVLSNLPGGTAIDSEDASTTPVAYITQYTGGGTPRATRTNGRTGNPVDQSATPGDAAGMLDVGRGYERTIVMSLNSVAPTNPHQYLEERSTTDLSSAVSALRSGAHNPNVEVRADLYGQLKFTLLTKRSDASKPGHGCYYQQVDVDKVTNFFTNVPNTMQVEPKKTNWEDRWSILAEENAEYERQQKARNDFQSEHNVNSREVKKAKNYVSVGVTAGLNLSTTRKFNFEMSASSSIDAKLVSIPAPSGLVDKLIEKL